MIRITGLTRGKVILIELGLCAALAKAAAAETLVWDFDIGGDMDEMAGFGPTVQGTDVLGSLITMGSALEAHVIRDQFTATGWTVGSNAPVAGGSRAHGSAPFNLHPSGILDGISSIRSLGGRPNGEWQPTRRPGKE